MQIIDFVVCEDIRFEEGNRRSFIGVVEDIFPVYADEKDEKWPKTVSFGISLRALLSLEELKLNPNSFELKLKIGNTEQTCAKSDLPPKPGAKQQKISIAAVFKNMPIKGPGKLTAILIIKNKAGDTIVESETPGSATIQAVPIPHLPSS